jgi:AhpD family alkylhydroperoxidase
MTRIAPGGVRQIGLGAWVFSRLAGRAMRTEPPAIFTTLGRTRGLFWGWLHFAGRLMPGGKLPRRDTELVILRVAHLRSCGYEWAHHQRLARRAGLTTDEIDRVRAGSRDGWTKRDADLLASVDALVGENDLTDELFAALRSHLDERQIIEFLLLVGHYDMLATTLTTLRVEPDARRS